MAHDQNGSTLKYVQGSVRTKIPRPAICPQHLRRHSLGSFAPRSMSNPPAMSQAPGKHLQEQLSSDCSSSLDSLDNLSMDDYWTEVENIKESHGSEPDDNNVEVKTPEEGELEADWLQDAGLSTLIREQSGDDDDIVLLSTLTRTQAAAVQRRVETCTRSMRKKIKQPVRDVRDVFAAPNSTSRHLKQQDVSDTQAEQRLKYLLPEEDKSEADPDRQETSSPGQGYSSKEELINFDVSYSEQATVWRKRIQDDKEARKRKDEGSLPQYVIHKNKLGMTRMGDLSPADMKKVHTLALIELTALFDTLDIEVKRHKVVKVKAGDNRLFGVPLTQLIENDQKIVPNIKVPLFLQELLCCLEQKGLETEGILRISGSVARMKNLQKELEENFYQKTFDWEKVNQNDAAGLLKMFIREMPHPLLTTEYLSAFAAVKNITDHKQRLHALNLLVLILPEPNRCTLKCLLEFLCKVIGKEKKNRMNLWNVSTIIAPNLFMHKGILNKIPDGKEKQQAEKAADIVRMLTHYQDILWIIPFFLVAQVRKLNENSSKRYQFYDKRLKNLLRKIHTEKDKQEKQNTFNKIRIQAPQLLKDTLEVCLEREMTTRNLVQHFHKHLHQDSWDPSNSCKCNGSTDSSEFYLYEVGGNIGERCLDPDTHIFDLLKVNPQAEWIMKQHQKPKES
ncbi:rho GTPase-activating protein 40 isoform X1 [Callorhinchus milii]|uniref:rho GTPase-activating protein 40 isoform X1 n=2 Tax=Callorhinchus milii TaxID=7868 RepID=UPI001C3F82BD|nr:rho GTPase-activating protein 40 isoform X1 [Callorhinchus milii]